MIAYNKRSYYCGQLRESHVGQEVTLAGWVHHSRDFGGLIFIVLRDYTGQVQLRFDPEPNRELYALAHGLKSEDVIAVEGDVASRGANANPNMPTGAVEILVRRCDILSRSETPPLEINDEVDASEEMRLKHRYLDMRRPKMQRIFRVRHRIAKTIRDFFDENHFVEIETPYLTKSTPEGARDYLVPSRIRPGSFYALPQSPQIFKQLFMIAGFDRYAQIVRCFRDEDLRADRQPEFTQLDMEMSFVQPEDVMTMVEGCVQRIFKAVLDMEIKLPLPRMPESEAVERFGTDRPDLRYGLELRDVTAEVREVDFRVFKESLATGGRVKAIVAPGAGGTLTRKITDGLNEELQGIGAGGLPLVKVDAGEGGPTFSTGIAKFLAPFADSLCRKLNAKPGDMVFFMPGTPQGVAKHLSYLRGRLAEILGLIPKNEWNLLWVVDFPLLTWDEEERRWFSTHHPFTAPRDEDLHLLESTPEKARSKAYDLVLNGTEMAGGSIRIHNRDVQKKVFSILGISEEEAQLRFSFLMDALRYGAPPHGGIAFGLDRWVMLLSAQESLRDVIAFPKTTKAACPLTGAPAPVSEAQLRELGLRLK